MMMKNQKIQNSILSNDITNDHVRYLPIRFKRFEKKSFKREVGRERARDGHINFHFKEKGRNKEV
jgi:hypothetical protein